MGRRKTDIHERPLVGRVQPNAMRSYSGHWYARRHARRQLSTVGTVGSSRARSGRPYAWTMADGSPREQAEASRFGGRRCARGHATTAQSGHKRTVRAGCFGTLRPVRGALRTEERPRPHREGEVNPPSTDAIGSMKAPVRVALMDFRGCRRGALRSGEQRLAFDAGEELGGSDFEFE